MRMRILFLAITIVMFFAVTIVHAEGDLALKRQDNERLYFYKTTSESMSLAASNWLGLKIDNAGIVYAAGQNNMIINTGIDGIERLGANDLAKGADVLFVSISGSKHLAVPNGYYKVRIAKNVRSSWIASFIDSRGKVVTTLPASVNTNNVNKTANNKVSFSAGIDGGGLYFDVRWGRLYIKIYIPSPV